MRIGQGLVLLASLGLAACGGGGSGGSASGGVVQGKLVEQGLTGGGVAGVTVTCETTGETDVTDADGSFTFEVPSGERIVVTFSAAPGASFGCDEPGDPANDGVDARGDGVDLLPLKDGQVVVVEIELADGSVVECWVDGRDGVDEGECPLLPDPNLAPGARGEIEVVREGDCLSLELEVADAPANAVLQAHLLAFGGTAELGALVVGADGTGHLEASVCADDLVLPPLPEDLPPFELPPFELPEGFPSGLPGDLPNGFPGFPDPSTLPGFPGFPEIPSLPELPDLDPFHGGLVVLVDADGRVVFVGSLPGSGDEPSDAWRDLPQGGPGGEGGLPPLPIDLGTLPPEFADAYAALLNALAQR